MVDFSVFVDHCCANSMVEIGGVSGGEVVFIIGDHRQDEFDLICVVCGVLDSVDGDLLGHLGPGMQFVQSLPSA